MTTVIVNNMKCAGCAKMVQEKLSKIYAGVEVSFADKTATIPSDNVDVKKLNEALADTPYNLQ